MSDNMVYFGVRDQVASIRRRWVSLWLSDLIDLGCREHGQVFELRIARSSCAPFRFDLPRCVVRAPLIAGHSPAGPWLANGYDASPFAALSTPGFSGFQPDRYINRNHCWLGRDSGKPAVRRMRAF